MILGAWSLGLFYGSAAVLLTAAAAAAMRDVPTRWRGLVLTLWFVVGLTSVAALVRGLDLWQTRSGYTVESAAAVVFGTRLFAIAALALVVAYVGRGWRLLS